MSGKDEKPQEESDFPKCSYCNCDVWIMGRACYEYTVMEEEDPGEVYKWTEGDLNYTGETTTWSCRDCLRLASEAQLLLLEKHFADAEWI